MRNQIESSGSVDFSNSSLTFAQETAYVPVVDEFFYNFNLLTEFISSKHKEEQSASINLVFKNLNFTLVHISAEFNYSLFFENYSDKYQSWVDMYRCLAEIMSSKYQKQTFDMTLSLTEWKTWPYSFSKALSSNRTSPVLTVDLYYEGNKFKVNKCENGMLLYLPVSAGSLVKTINEKKERIYFNKKERKK